MLRLRVQVGDRALEDNPSLVDDRDVVGDLLDLVEEVRGEKHGHAVLDELADHPAKLVNSRRIEAVGGFIQDQELRIGEQRARDA